MKTNPVRVLIVEDEESFVEALSVGLQREGYEVVVARTGPEALTQFAKHEVDIILLDVMLPGISGIDVCREIRSTSDVPIIMVTAKGEEIDTVVGLEVGADDYVAKPYRLRELIARMRALLRRSTSNEDAASQSDKGGQGEAVETGGQSETGKAGGQGGVGGQGETGEAGEASEAVDPNARVLRVGSLRLDVDRHEVTVGGVPAQLPLKEFQILRLLMRRVEKVVPRAEFIRQIWGDDYVGDTKTLDVHIKRLRTKIEIEAIDAARIVTVRRVGYKLKSGL